MVAEKNDNYVPARTTILTMYQFGMHEPARRCKVAGV